ncbi:SURF1 family protein [Neptunicella sp. SCSIO 80796]|uniref:SURF1 family protein n=1 Tax=Neptunicella plasticusilytica TaxID=3117012 RepID=UPI003A4DB404
MNSVNGNFRLPIIATLVSLTAFVILIGLGVWQLDRAAQKQQRQQQIEQRKLQNNYSLANILALSGDVRDLPVVTSGHFNTRHYFMIDNRMVNGQPGYHVVAILTTASGNIAVNLGWLAAPVSRDVIPHFNLPSEQQVIEGVIALPSLNPMIQETEHRAINWPVRIQQLDLSVIEQLSGITLLPLVILAKPDPAQPLIRDWQSVVMPAEKHIAYAIQWFGLAIALLVIFYMAIIRKNREVNDEQ